jgi:oxygen-independent coproporphyrinogen-3 oxidase
MYTRYLDRLCEDIARSAAIAEDAGAVLVRHVDSIYLGGGTPSVLSPTELQRIFASIREHFEVEREAEITMECAPGTLSPELLEAACGCGVNRVSLGVQSFADKEAAGVGRLHTRAVVLDDLERLRRMGLDNINLDLIAGLPHQTLASWRFSLEEALSAWVPHVSVYMLEIDDDSRLGKELIAGGTRYHAHFVPDDDATAEFYLHACQMLENAEVKQYEISNFARTGQAPAGVVPLDGDGSSARISAGEAGSLQAPAEQGDLPTWHSRHNLKYWTRRPYLGFGVDAHSMLPAGVEGEGSEFESVRFATPDTLEKYLEGRTPEVTRVGPVEALEEGWFLGLRLNRGVEPMELARAFGAEAAARYNDIVVELEQAGLLQRAGARLRLTTRGRLVSNEVFERFLVDRTARSGPDPTTSCSPGSGRPGQMPLRPHPARSPVE